MLPRGRPALPRGRGDRATTGLLGGIVLVALALRLTGLTWGLPWVFHPDENHYVAVARQMVRSGDPNPHYFENPSLLTYLIAGELLLLRGLGPPGLVEANATVLARLDGALLGTAGVVLVFLVGRRLFDRPVGLASALFLAVAFLHVRDSHYGVNDVPATTVLTLALLLAARAAGRPTAARLALAGLAVGLAASTKYHLGLGLVLVPAAHWLGRQAAGRPLLDGPARRALAGAGLAAAGGYLLGTPYTLLDAGGFLEGFLDQYATAGGRWFGQALEPVPLLYLTHLLQGFGALPLAPTEPGGADRDPRTAAFVIMQPYPTPTAPVSATATLEPGRVGLQIRSPAGPAGRLHPGSAGDGHPGMSAQISDNLTASATPGCGTPAPGRAGREGGSTRMYDARSVRPAGSGTVLVVGEDADERVRLVRGLTRAGYRVVAGADGARALALVASERPDLVVLELDLPTMDGFEVCRRIRLESWVPIVALTARRDEADILRGFRLGIDACVAKPCSARIVVARAAAILRRTGDRGHAERGAPLHQGYVRAGRLELDLPNFEARMDEKPVRLTPLEVRVLHLLATNPGRTVPYERLIEHAWGHAEGSTEQLKICIFKLRKKLGLSVGGDAGIRAVVGTGYVLHGLDGAAGQGAA
jgi:two-component system OmpR family response regulator